MYQKYAALRDERHMTDHQVAKELGFSSSTLYCWAKGQYTPKLDKLLAIAKLFNVSIEALLGE